MKKQQDREVWLTVALLAWEAAKAARARGADADPLDILTAMLRDEEPANVT